MKNADLIAEARERIAVTEDAHGNFDPWTLLAGMVAPLADALEAAEARIDSILDADPPVSRIEEMHAAALNRAISAEDERDALALTVAAIRAKAEKQASLTGHWRGVEYTRASNHAGEDMLDILRESAK